MNDLRPDDSIARNRFILINLARIGFTLLVLLGLVIWQGNLVRPGGAPAIGIPLAAVGLAASFLVPQQLVRKWRTPPGA